MTLKHGHEGTEHKSMGFRYALYIDDGISGHKNKQLAIEASSMQKKDFTDGGFIYNDKKSQWEPRQCGSWLGFMIDTVRFLLHQLLVLCVQLDKLNSLNPWLLRHGTRANEWLWNSLCC